MDRGDQLGFVRGAVEIALEVVVRLERVGDRSFGGHREEPIAQLLYVGETAIHALGERSGCGVSGPERTAFGNVDLTRRLKRGHEDEKRHRGEVHPIHLTIRGRERIPPTTPSASQCASRAL